MAYLDIKKKKYFENLHKAGFRFLHVEFQAEDSIYYIISENIAIVVSYRPTNGGLTYRVELQLYDDTQSPKFLYVDEQELPSLYEEMKIFGYLQ